jgi:hypothetical protein
LGPLAVLRLAQVRRRPPMLRPLRRRQQQHGGESGAEVVHGGANAVGLGPESEDGGGELAPPVLNLDRG